MGLDPNPQKQPLWAISPSPHFELRFATFGCQFLRPEQIQSEPVKLRLPWPKKVRHSNLGFTLGKAFVGHLKDWPSDCEDTARGAKHFYL